MTILRAIFITLLIVSFAYASKPYVDNTLLKRVENKYKVYAKRRFLLQQKKLDSAKGKSDFVRVGLGSCTV